MDFNKFQQSGTMDLNDMSYYGSEQLNNVLPGVFNSQVPVWNNASIWPANNFAVDPSLDSSAGLSLDSSVDPFWNQSPFDFMPGNNEAITEASDSSSGSQQPAVPYDMVAPQQNVGLTVPTFPQQGTGTVPFGEIGQPIAGTSYRYSMAQTPASVTGMAALTPVAGPSGAISGSQGINANLGGGIGQPSVGTPHEDSNVQPVASSSDTVSLFPLAGPSGAMSGSQGTNAVDSSGIGQPLVGMPHDVPVTQPVIPLAGMQGPQPVLTIRIWPTGPYGTIPNPKDEHEKRYPASGKWTHEEAKFLEAEAQEMKRTVIEPMREELARRKREFGSNSAQALGYADMYGGEQIKWRHWVKKADLAVKRYENRKKWRVEIKRGPNKRTRLAREASEATQTEE